MLIYHPAYDAYHCVFRMLAVAERVTHAEVDKARLLDFYLVFPGAIGKMRLPSEMRSLRQLAAGAANVYRDPVSTASAFLEMRHIQEAALKSIAASGLIKIDSYSAGYVERTSAALPETIERKVQEFLSINSSVVDAVLNELAKIPLLGQNGLKHRSQLMEYRYDVV